MITIEDVDNEAGKANTSPTEKQREAGNYMKGHISVKGMRIAIENPKGSKRFYGDGTKYNVMNNHYGYFNITKGKDGDAVDVFLGPDIEDFDKVYCVDQNKANGEFDETKVMLGFSSKEEAKDAYMSNYSPDWKGFRDITAVSIKDFKKWLYRGRKQRQPFADYVYIQKKKLDEMKKTVKLNEADIMKAIKSAVKKIIKEAYTTNDVADMLGADDDHDGPTNEGPAWDEQVYYQALAIMKKFDYYGDEAIENVERVMFDYIDGAYRSDEFMNMTPERAAVVIASKAMEDMDSDYYYEQVEPYLNENRKVRLSESEVKNIIKNSVIRFMTENKLTRDDDFSYPEQPDDEYFDSQYEEWKAKHEPTQKDWDDFGFWASNDEPDLVNDEIGAAHDREHPEDAFLIDADDEGEGYSRDYFQGVEYAKNLIAKSKVPEGMVEELNQKENDGTISAYELGILDTLDEG